MRGLLLGGKRVGMRHVFLLHVADDLSDHALQKPSHVGVAQVHEGVLAAVNQCVADLLDKIQVGGRNAKVLFQVHVLVLWIHFVCFTGSI